MSVHGLRVSGSLLSEMARGLGRRGHLRAEARHGRQGAHQSLVSARLSLALPRPARQLPLPSAQEVRVQLRLVRSRPARRHQEEQRLPPVAAHARLSRQLHVSHVSDQEVAVQGHQLLHERRMGRAAALLERRR